MAVVLAAVLGESLLPGRVLSPADVLLAQASYRPSPGLDLEPQNRLLMDPVLQFQPWMEFNRAILRTGRLPLWNPHAGCGVPHLANGQSAVFDPFQLVAYATEVPSSLAWMAFGRLWVAGVGMFLLARTWGIGPIGRWFAGLVYPLCGFLIVWLLYPVTPVAIWLPWMMLTTDRVVSFPGSRRAGLLAIVAALAIAGGHIQTTAHVFIACGLYAIFRTARTSTTWRSQLRIAGWWGAGVGLGCLVGAVQIVPLWNYLHKSPVWEDRRHELEPWWTISRPRLLESACTAFPYLYGSQRQGHPNLARRLGVNNLNESSGGYAGLVTLFWLAPLGLRQARRCAEPVFLGGLAALGALGAFRLPPVDNLLRALPVLDVTDNRRLVLWLAFALTMLGGFGIDALGRGERLARSWAVAWLALAVVFVATALAVPRLESRLRSEAASRVASGSDSASIIQRARRERQVKAAVSFLPRYYGAVAVELALCGLLALGSRRVSRLDRATPVIVLCLTIVELWLFGNGLNPAIPRELHDRVPPVVHRLRERLGTHGRTMGIGEELLPNQLMRHGLNDPRNYDSVELTRSVEWFAPLYEPGEETRTSRRTITWEGVRRCRERLEQSGVGAVVGATRPPPGLFGEVESLDEVWIGWLRPEPWATLSSDSAPRVLQREPGAATIEVVSKVPDRLLVRETWDPGWRARIDGKEAEIETYADTFMTLSIPPGKHVVELTYYPEYFMITTIASACGALGVILALTGGARF